MSCKVRQNHHPETLLKKRIIYEKTYLIYSYSLGTCVGFFPSPIPQTFFFGTLNTDPIFPLSRR